jgi:uncharacterized membrane protein YbhN (UPF0104 family)
LAASVGQRPAWWSPALTCRLRIGLGLACPLVLIGVMVANWSAVAAGGNAMTRADGEWVVLAAVGVVATWVAGTCCQLGAVTARLPVRRVLATQVAGSFTNHVLPAGVGVAAVNLRMLRRAGLSRVDATGAVALNTAAGVIVHLCGLVVVLTLIPRPGQFDPPARIELLVPVAAALVVLGVWIWRSPTRTGPRRGSLRAGLAQARVVLRRPGRAVLLWLGSAAVPALHIAVLLAVLHSLSMPAPVAATTIAYLGASAVAAAIPSPGGFGSLDAALAAALTALGTPAGHAIAAVVGYRLLTVWLPLLPGAATFLLLLRRRLI